jgi:hypothetical protein
MGVTGGSLSPPPPTQGCDEDEEVHVGMGIGEQQLHGGGGRPRLTLHLRALSLLPLPTGNRATSSPPGQQAPAAQQTHPALALWLPEQAAPGNCDPAHRTHRDQVRKLYLRQVFTSPERLSVPGWVTWKCITCGYPKN